jgi:hypothetical protein
MVIAVREIAGRVFTIPPMIQQVLTSQGTAPLQTPRGFNAPPPRRLPNHIVPVSTCTFVLALSVVCADDQFSSVVNSVVRLGSVGLGITSGLKCLLCN